MAWGRIEYSLVDLIGRAEEELESPLMCRRAGREKDGKEGTEASENARYDLV